MGNSCFCNTTNNYLTAIKVNICLDKQSFNEITDNNLYKAENTQEKRERGINELKKYFSQHEQEIINEINQKEKIKKLFYRKKKESLAHFFSDNKYELMLKRLLEQKNIKRNGPKRRETIRKDDKIKSLINDILKENNGKEITKKSNEQNLSKGNTLIIKNKKNSKVRFSITINKEEVLNNIKKKVNKKLIKNAITLNEINEGNISSGLGKKETNKK